MAFANFENFPAEKIDEAYNLRKAYRKSSRAKFKVILGEQLIRRYRQGLMMSEVEKMFFDYEGLSIKMVGLSGAGTSLDIDSTRDEKQLNDLTF